MSFSDLTSCAQMQTKLDRPARPTPRGVTDVSRPLQDVCNVRWDRAGSGALELLATAEEAAGRPAPTGKGALDAEEAAGWPAARETLFTIASSSDAARTPRLLARGKQQLGSLHHDDEHDTNNSIRRENGGSPGLTSAMSRLGLDYEKAPIPASPPPFSFQTPTTVRSGASLAFTTPSTSGVRRAAASTPPRTPEECVLAVLADEADDDELKTDAAGGRCSLGPDALDSAARGWGRRASDSAASDGSSSSGDELDERDLERMGLSPLSLPESMSRTPVDDVIDCMLAASGAADGGGEQGERGPVSPVPFRGAVSPRGSACKAQGA